MALDWSRVWSGTPAMAIRSGEEKKRVCGAYQAMVDADLLGVELGVGDAGPPQRHGQLDADRPGADDEDVGVDLGLAQARSPGRV